MQFFGVCVFFSGPSRRPAVFEGFLCDVYPWLSRILWQNPCFPADCPIQRLAFSSSLNGIKWLPRWLTKEQPGKNKPTSHDFPIQGGFCLVFSPNTRTLFTAVVKVLEGWDDQQKSHPAEARNGKDEYLRDFERWSWLWNCDIDEEHLGCPAL